LPNSKKNKASFYIVALVDLLGQGAELERFAGIFRDKANCVLKKMSNSGAVWKK
jgi:hypothetical protein